MGGAIGSDEAARRIAIGRAIEVLRKRRDLTQKEAASAAGLPYWTPGLWATGKAVRDDQLEQILVALEASHADLEREIDSFRNGRSADEVPRDERGLASHREESAALRQAGRRPTGVPQLPLTGQPPPSGQPPRTAGADLTIAEGEALLRELAYRQGLAVDVTYRVVPADG